MLSKLLQLKRITDRDQRAALQATRGFESLGAKPWAIFLQFFEIKTYFNEIGSHFASVQRHLKQLNL